jgi:hypothetical protein
MARFTKILKDKAMKKLVSDKKIHEQVYKKSKLKFDIRKKKMISNFMNHPVTKEIEGGADAYNSSGTIIGGGNLFSFIGFNGAYNPIAPVRRLLDNSTRLEKTKPRIQKTKNRVYMGYRVHVPSKEDLSAVSKMPWEPGSWLFKIESGISGLGYYIYQKNISASRSGTGIQADGSVRQGMYKRTRYMSAILKTFKGGFGK